MAKETVDETGTEVAQASRGNLVPADRAAVQEAALVLIRMIPDMPESDGAGIIADLLNATSPDELNRSSKLPAGQDLGGTEMTITDVHKLPSDLDGEDDGTGVKLGHYLIVDALVGTWRKPLRWQTSAPGLAVPVAQLYVWGKLPAHVRINRADKPTRRGFYPMNMEIIKAGV